MKATATFTGGSATLEATVGQIVIVLPETPHAFRNSGDGPLRQIDNLPNGHITTGWREA